MPQVEVFEEKMPIFLLQEGREEEEKEKRKRTEEEEEEVEREGSLSLSDKVLDLLT